MTRARPLPCARLGTRVWTSRAGGAGQPLTGPAVVDVRLAVAPRVARLAVAAVAAVGVLAGGAHAARAFHTLVDVDLAGLPWGRGRGSRWLSQYPLGTARPPGAGPLLSQGDPLGASREGGLSKGLPPDLGPSRRQIFKPGRTLQPTGSSPKDGDSLARVA